MRNIFSRSRFSPVTLEIWNIGHILSGRRRERREERGLRHQWGLLERPGQALPPPTQPVFPACVCMARGDGPTLCPHPSPPRPSCSQPSLRCETLRQCPLLGLPLLPIVQPGDCPCAGTQGLAWDPQPPAPSPHRLMGSAMCSSLSSCLQPRQSLPHPRSAPPGLWGFAHSTAPPPSRMPPAIQHQTLPVFQVHLQDHFFHEALPDGHSSLLGAPGELSVSLSHMTMSVFSRAI